MRVPRCRFTSRRSIVAVVLSVVIGGVLAGEAQAGAAYTYDRALAWWAVNTLEVASQYTGTETKTIPYRTYVRCYADAAAFEAPLLAKKVSARDAKLVVAYYANHGEIYLRSGTCDRIRRFTGTGGRRPLVTGDTASAMATLLHETLHRQGVTDERITECFANEAVKYAGWMAQWYSLRVRDDETWQASQKAGIRAQKLAFTTTARWVATNYRMPESECRHLVQSFSWAQYRKPI